MRPETRTPTSSSRLTVSLTARIQQWIDWTEERVRAVHEAASAAPLGGDDRWRALLASLEVEPLEEAERRVMLAGAPTTRGAIPVEVRRALEAILVRAEAAAKGFESALFEKDDDTAEQAVDRWQSRLSSLVDGELRRYLTSVRPVATTGSIFATAAATSQPWLTGGPTEGPGARSLTCPTCGAPRVGDNRETRCDYCGSEIL